MDAFARDTAAAAGQRHAAELGRLREDLRAARGAAADAALGHREDLSCYLEELGQTREGVTAAAARGR
eukprot:9855641-Lingulodinium_polyedra.AAC.1